MDRYTDDELRAIIRDRVDTPKVMDAFQRLLQFIERTRPRATYTKGEPIQYGDGSLDHVKGLDGQPVPDEGEPGILIRLSAFADLHAPVAEPSAASLREAAQGMFTKPAEPAPRFAVGGRVTHAKYGSGRIEALEPDHCYVWFDVRGAWPSPGHYVKVGDLAPEVPAPPAASEREPGNVGRDLHALWRAVQEMGLAAICARLDRLIEILETKR